MSTNQTFDDMPLDEERIDALARAAGRDLRVTASNDGLARARRTRRTQQITRTALGGTTIVALIAIGTFALDRQTKPIDASNQPSVTEAQDPNASAPPTTAPTASPVVLSTIPTTLVPSDATTPSVTAPPQPITIAPGRTVVPLETPIRQLTRTVIATLPIGDGPDGSLGQEVCGECDPGRPYAPVVATNGEVIIADPVNQNLVIVGPMRPNTVVVPLAERPAGHAMVWNDGQRDWVLLPMPPVGAPTNAYGKGRVDRLALVDLLAGRYAPTAQYEFDAFPSELRVRGDLLIGGADGSLTIGQLSASPRPTVAVTYHLDQTPPTVEVSDGINTRIWEFPAEWRVSGLGETLPDGSVVLFGVDSRQLEASGFNDFLVIRLLPDGTVHVGKQVAGEWTSAYDSTQIAGPAGVVVLGGGTTSFEVVGYDLPSDSAASA